MVEGPQSPLRNEGSGGGAASESAIVFDDLEAALRGDIASQRAKGRKSKPNAREHARLKGGSSYDALEASHPGVYQTDGRFADGDRSDAASRQAWANRSSTVAESLNWFWTRDSQELAFVQQLLYNAGFLDDEPLEWGRYDPDEIDGEAWKRVVQLAAKARRDPMELLQEYAGLGAGEKRRGRRGEKARPKPNIVLSSKDDIQAIANETARNVLGRKLTDEEAAAIIAKFHARERSDAQRANAAAESETGGVTVEDGVSGQTLAENLVREARPVEARAHDTAQAFESFLGIIGA